MSDEPRVLGHNRCRLARADEENVERQRRRRAGWLEFAFRPGKIERAKRLVDKHSPALSSDEPGNGDASAVGAELIAALAAPHAVSGPAPVELRTTLAETKQWCVARGERD